MDRIIRYKDDFDRDHSPKTCRRVIGEMVTFLHYNHPNLEEFILKFDSSYLCMLEVEQFIDLYQVMLDWDPKLEQGVMKLFFEIDFAIVRCEEANPDLPPYFASIDPARLENVLCGIDAVEDEHTRENAALDYISSAIRRGLSWRQR